MPYAGYPEEDSTKAHFLAGIYFMYIGKDARGEPIWVHRNIFTALGASPSLSFLYLVVRMLKKLYYLTLYEEEPFNVRG